MRACPAGAFAEASRLSAGLASRRASKAVAPSLQNAMRREKIATAHVFCKQNMGGCASDMLYAIKRTLAGAFSARQDLALAGARLEVLRRPNRRNQKFPRIHPFLKRIQANPGFTSISGGRSARIGRRKRQRRSSLRSINSVNIPKKVTATSCKMMSTTLRNTLETVKKP